MQLDNVRVREPLHTLESILQGEFLKVASREENCENCVPSRIEDTEGSMLSTTPMMDLFTYWTVPDTR
jgi:hypothetical protein